MRTLPTNILNQLLTRGAKHAHLLIWFQGRNRDTDEFETIGFWTGADQETFVVDGETRTYYAAGNVLKVEPLVSEIGLSVRTSRVTLSAISPEVEIAVLGYEIREAPCQMHIAYFDPITHELIDTPQRVFKGFTAGVDIIRPATGGEARCDISLRSSARALTRTSALKKSDVALRGRAPADAFRQYTDVSGTVEVVWGERRTTWADRNPPPPPQPVRGPGYGR
tara:strand:- start:1157 stop:1825 length:669 start_codon:yes stop_codon:yes gene_type:complete